MRVSVVYTSRYMHILVRFRSVKFESARHDSRSSLNVVCSYLLWLYSHIYMIILVYLPSSVVFTRTYMRVSVVYTRMYMHIWVKFRSVKLESARYDSRSSLNVV